MEKIVRNHLALHQGKEPYFVLVSRFLFKGSITTLTVYGCGGPTRLRSTPHTPKKHEEKQEKEEKRKKTLWFWWSHHTVQKKNKEVNWLWWPHQNVPW